MNEKYERFYIVMTGFAGAFGTSLIAEKTEEKLKNRFPGFLIETAKSFQTQGFAYNAQKLFSGKTEEMGIVRIHPLSEGGVFKGLWELGKEADAGFGVELKKIPIKQETIEICNYVDINPYELMSNGAELIMCKDPLKICEVLTENGIESEIIGRTPPEKKRVIYYDDEERFLEPRRGDSILELSEVLPREIKE